jgi:hypothetical protein
MKIKETIKRIMNFFSKSSTSVTGRVLSEGEIARDKGIQQSLDSANTVVKNWSDIAYGFLLGYADSHKEFMVEDMRNASVGFVPEPPSKRAWGGIAVRAAKNGIIRRKCFQNVKNVKAHRTPATLWEVV